MQYNLAVDGGGTKTNVICLDMTGQIVGESIVGPTSLAATSLEGASENLAEGIQEATKSLSGQWQISRMVMGLAGLDSASEYDRALPLFSNVLAQYQCTDILLVNDTVIALESGTNKPNALVLIAGTGSHCYGRNAFGKTAKSGGMDYLLADQGSGYEIGRAVLRAAVKSFDGRIKHSLLEDEVCRYFNIASISDLKQKVYHPLLTKTEIAAVAKIAVSAFEQKDKVATQILEKAVADLYQMIAAVVERLELQNQDVDVVFVGGISQVDFVYHRLQTTLSAVYPKIALIRPTQDPVYGAVKLVLGRK